MGKTIYHDLYALSKYLSTYLPLSNGIPLDRPVNDIIQTPGAAIPEGEHWAVVSKTGNGKTTFDLQLCKAYRRKMPWLNLYILDTKKQGDFSEKDGKIYRSYDPPPLLTGIGQSQIWQPVIDDVEAYDEYLQAILHHGKPCIVLIDESKNLKQNGRVPKGYELILAQGRKPGIHVITNYQEIAEGLRQGLSQSTHIVGFSVWNAYDERMLKSYLRLPSDKPMPLAGKRSFLYINKDTMGTPKLYNNYQQFIPDFMNWEMEKPVLQSMPSNY
jgi:hypothetical protein